MKSKSKPYKGLHPLIEYFRKPLQTRILNHLYKNQKSTFSLEAIIEEFPNEEKNYIQRSLDLLAKNEQILVESLGTAKIYSLRYSYLVFRKESNRSRLAIGFSLIAIIISAIDNSFLQSLVNKKLQTSDSHVIPKTEAKTDSTSITTNNIDSLK